MVTEVASQAEETKNMSEVELTLNVMVTVVAPHDEVRRHRICLRFSLP